MKIHFGAGNASAEDYYYVNIGDATLHGLGLSSGNGPGSGKLYDGSFVPGNYGYYRPSAGSPTSDVKMLWANLENGAPLKLMESGLWVLGVIPQGTTNLRVHLSDNEWNDSLQLFDLHGNHILGTQLGTSSWTLLGEGNRPDADVYPGQGDKVVNKHNGFVYYEDAEYNDAFLHDGDALPFTPGEAGNKFVYNGMNIGYSGDGNTGVASGELTHEYLTIDETKEDLILMCTGRINFSIQASWDNMPYYPGTYGAGTGQTISIKTQDLAQDALGKLDGAIQIKDSIRSHLGAMQNRLSNTITNLSIQTDNLQAAEARISDVDVSLEMTEFIRRQILTQAGTAMLAQANSIPRMLMNLLRQ